VAALAMMLILMTSGADGDRLALRERIWGSVPWRSLTSNTRLRLRDHTDLQDVCLTSSETITCSSGPRLWQSTLLRLIAGFEARGAG